ncbi:unnamed protein product [Didymodactylos carnosus]|uniref:G-protein coupled receptors family 1 profile domain-containing protein n=1 Tax=Didymodactylos carnosus TaxID=1234261 RepID=A0A816C6Y2_9BILA|nr:unnamed protein product [Didymodactylos carnosus]CAF4507834.1 unnamed protein product [Didymodactylos carnosus]
MPICFILGNIGNCFNLIVFGQRSSRSNSCLLYFLSASVINIVIINFGLVLRIVRGLWNIDPSANSLWFCRWRLYLTSTSFLIYRYSIVLACIDRMCASSRHAWMRSVSRTQVAYRLIAIKWILCFAYFTPSLVFPVIRFGQCVIPPGTTYATYLPIVTLIQAFLIPSTMSICGLITFTHLKSMQSRVVPTNTDANDTRKKVSQYIIMLFVQVACDWLGNLSYPCYLIFSLIFPAPLTPLMTAIASFWINMSTTIPFINYSAAFYLHTLSSPAFRLKLLRFIGQIMWFQRLIRLNNEPQNTQTMGMITMRGRTANAVDHQRIQQYDETV